MDKKPDDYGKKPKTPTMGDRAYAVLYGIWAAAKGGHAQYPLTQFEADLKAASTEGKEA